MFGQRAKGCVTGTRIHGREPRGCAAEQMTFSSSMRSKVLHSSSPQGWVYTLVPLVTSLYSQMSTYEVRLHVPHEAVRLCLSI